MTAFSKMPMNTHKFSACPKCVPLKVNVSVAILSVFKFDVVFEPTLIKLELGLDSSTANLVVFTLSCGSLTLILLCYYLISLKNPDVVPTIFSGHEDLFFSHFPHGSHFCHHSHYCYHCLHASLNSITDQVIVISLLIEQVT